MPKALPNARGHVRVVHGCHDGNFLVAGYAVEVVRTSLRYVFNIGPDNKSLVNGFEVDRGCRLAEGDVVEFVRPWGWKGGEQPKWLSLKEAAAYLRIGEKLLKSLCKAGKIAFIQHGNRGRKRTGEYRFEITWLDDFIEREMTQVRPCYKQTLRPRIRPQITEVFIDPRECGNPFETN